MEEEEKKEEEGALGASVRVRAGQVSHVGGIGTLLRWGQ